MQTKLANLLLAHAPLAALVGNRVQWDTLPQGTPHGRINMRVASGITDYHMQGPSGLEFSRVQFECQGESAAKARAIAEALKARLSGYQGVFQGYHFQLFKAVGQRTDHGKVDSHEWFTDMRDFEIHWAEA